MTANRIIYRADEKMEDFYKSKAHPAKRRRSRGKKKHLLSLKDTPLSGTKITN